MNLPIYKRVIFSTKAIIIVVTPSKICKIGSKGTDVRILSLENFEQAKKIPDHACDETPNCPAAKEGHKYDTGLTLGIIDLVIVPQWCLPIHFHNYLVNAARKPVDNKGLSKQSQSVGYGHNPELARLIVFHLFVKVKLVALCPKII
jgi:hypothetical protein